MKNSFVLILFAILFSVNKAAENIDKIAFLDIQNAEKSGSDAIVIHSTDPITGKKIYAMIDSGIDDAENCTSKIEEYFKKNGISEIEWFLLSHFHSDHMGGLKNLLANKIVKIKNFYAKEYQNIDSNIRRGSISDYRKNRLDTWNQMIETLKANKVPIHYITSKTKELSLGNYKFTLFNQEEIFKGFEKECDKKNICNENSNSVIAVGKNGNKFYYLNGDIDTYPENFNKSKNQTLVKAYQDKRCDKWIQNALKMFNIDHIDVYKVSHHGNLYNNIPETFKIAKPDICVINAHRNFLTNYRYNELMKRIKDGNPKTKTYWSGYGTVIVSQDRNGKIKVFQGLDEHLDIKNLQPQWIYNHEVKKCLYAPKSREARPLLSNCDNSDNSKWVVASTVGGLQQFRSKAHLDWCLTIKSLEKGIITIDYCNEEFGLKYGNETSHKDNAIRTTSSNKCLDIYDPKDINKKSFTLNLNPCDEKNALQNKWSLWDTNPSDSKIVWIHNKNSKKCLYAPSEFNYRPKLVDCDDSSQSKWFISSSTEGFIRSVAYPDWCIDLKNKKEGTIFIGACDNKNINIHFSYPTNKENDIKSTSDDKCLGLLKSEDKKLNLNSCVESKADQQWEIIEKNPNSKNLEK